MRSFGITNAAPYATAPAVGSAGDTYYNTTSKTLYLSDGITWNAVSGGGGGSSTANYWISRLVANTAISTTIEGTLPIAAANMVAGFTLGAGGANIVCQVAGKYAASLVLMTGTSTASPNPFWVGIQHYRGATGIIAWDNIGLAAVNGYPYNQVVATGEFDMQVGDTLACVAQAPATTYTVGAQSTFMVWPMGGPKGDTGPAGISGALSLASWFYSTFNNLPSGGVTFNNANSTAQLILPTSPISAQNFTRHTSGGVLVGQSGKYLVEMHVSVYANRAVALSWMVGIVRVYRGGVTADPDIVTIGPGTSAGWYTSVAHAVQLDLVAGDLVLFYGNPSDTCDLDTRSWLSISPIGGNKGDPGTPGTSVGTTAWTTFPFAAGWNTFSGYQLCQYRLEGDRVFLRGLCQQTVLGNVTLGTLPAGFRPPAQALMHTLAFGNTAKDHIQRIEMSPVGVLSITAPVINEVQGYLTLDGLSYSITT